MLKLTLGASAALILTALAAAYTTGLRVVYFAQRDGHVPLYSTIDRDISTESITQYAPMPPEGPFSARWLGYLYVPQTGTYVFSSKADGDVSLSVDPVLADDTTTLHHTIPIEQPVTLGAGVHAISISYAHESRRYGIDVRMARIGEPLTRLKPWTLSRTAHRSAVYEAIRWIELAAVMVVLAWAAVALMWIARRVPIPSAIAIISSTALFAVAAATDSPEWLRGPPQWQWAFHAASAVVDVEPALLCAAAALAWLAFLVYGGAPVARRAALGIALAPIAAIVVQLGMLHLEGGGAAATLARDTQSVTMTSFYTVAASEASRSPTFLSTYTRTLPDLPMHAATHPPGPILYYRVVIDAFRTAPGLARRAIDVLQEIGVHPQRLGDSGSPGSAALAAAALAGGFGAVLFTALTCWPIAAMVAMAGGDALAAAEVAALWAFCPAAVFFSPMFDQVVMFLVASCAALACAAMLAELRVSRIACGLGSGVSAGLALFSSFGAAPMLAAAAVFTLVLAYTKGVAWRRVLATGLLACGGVALVFALPAIEGYDEVAAARVALRVHFERFMAGRSRSVWLRFNLLDFSVFVGWPLLAWGVTHLARRRLRAVLTVPGPALLWAMLIVVVGLDLADVTRGEVGRLWMPLVPLMYAATAIAALGPSAARTRDSRATSCREGAERLVVGAALAVTMVTLGLYWAP